MSSKKNEVKKIMDISEIISDAIKYPLSDWEKILMLGVIIVISSISSLVSDLGVKNGILLTTLGIVGILVGLLVEGYMFRIVRSSLSGISELPNFDEQFGMFKDGLKVVVAEIIYALPAILIFIISVAIAAITTLGTAGITELSNSAVMLGILVGAGIGGVIALLYMLIILPIMAVAIANMALNDEFAAAFRFHEILEKIREISWGNLLIWYIVMIVLLIILTLLGGIISGAFSLLHPFIGSMILYLLIMPYIDMFLSRSVALACKT